MEGVYEADPYIMEDIVRGVVFLLDPSILDACGATFVEGERRIFGPHFALCLDAKGDETIWVFLTSKDGPWRGVIPFQELLGNWNNKTIVNRSSQFYNTQGLMLATRDMVRQAAAGDYSRRGGRRYVNYYFTAEIAGALIPGW